MFCRLFRRRSSRVERESPSSKPLVRQEPVSELYDLDAAEEIYFGQVTTFAEVKHLTLRRTSQGSGMRIKVCPYFGPLAGREILFCINQSRNGADRTLVYVDGTRISTRLDLSRSSPNPSRGRGSVRDTCIHFVHDARRYEDHIPLPQPKSLLFLCTKHIHLRGVLPPGMPLREAKKFNSTVKQSVIVRVWPSRYLPAGEGCTAARNAVKLRIPVHISFAELGWYLREKLGLPASSSLRFRELDSLDDQQHIQPVTLRHTALECFVKSASQPRPRAFTASPRPLPLPVMLVGRGIVEVVVSPTTTVVEFEDAVIQEFGLSEDCFLYIPALFSHQVSYTTGLKMYATANRRSVSLLDRHSRRFPIVSEVDPNLFVEYRELPLYNRTVRDAGLLHEERVPLVCFDVPVLGPTVPLLFKAITTTSILSTNSGSSSSSGEHCSNFVNLTIEPRIISINPHWTTATLLKYVDCVSRFACRKLLMNGTVVEKDTGIGKLFDREWMVRNPRGGQSLSPNVLRVVS